MSNNPQNITKTRKISNKRGYSASKWNPGSNFENISITVQVINNRVNIKLNKTIFGLFIKCDLTLTFSLYIL